MIAVRGPGALIDRMTLRGRRVLFVVLLLAGQLAPLVFILPLILAESLDPGAVSNVPDVLWLPHLVLMIGLPLPLLYYAAKAAVGGRLPGGALTVLAVWWLLGVLLALTNWSYGLEDALVQAVTLDVVVPSANGFFTTPSGLVDLGVSKGFARGLPWETLWLMGCYAVMRVRSSRQQRAARDSTAAGQTPGFEVAATDQVQGARSDTPLT